MILYVLNAGNHCDCFFFLHFMCNMAKIQVRVLRFQLKTI